MKYLLILFLCYLFMTIIANADEDVLHPKGKPGGYEDVEYSENRSPVTFGIEAGVNFNLFSQDMSWMDLQSIGYPAHGTVYDGLTSASGFSPHFGGLVDIPINYNMGLQVRISYDMKNFGASTSGTENFYNSTTGFYETHQMILDVDVTSAYITFSPLFRYNFNENLFLTAGPTIHILSGDIETTWKPKSVDGIPLGNSLFMSAIGFTNETSGSITLTPPYGRPPLNEEPKKTRVGLECGIGYKIPLNQKKSIWFVPQGRFQLMLTTMTGDGGVYIIDSFKNEYQYEVSSKRTFHSLQFALALWFDI